MSNNLSIVTALPVRLQAEKPKTGKPTVIRLQTATIRVWETKSGEVVIEVKPP